MTASDTQYRTWWGFSGQFWILVIGTLINATGSALIFPLISLYFARRFNVTESEAGWIFSLYAIVSLLSGAAGGVLTDRYGRKVVMIIGLASAILSSLIMAFAMSLTVVLLAIVVIGLLQPVFGPAVNAMIADMLPESQRQRGYGMIRVAANLGVAIGPLLGTLVIDNASAFLLLFVGDAITSGVFALFIAFLIRETKPDTASTSEEPSDDKTPQEKPGLLRNILSQFLSMFKGYGQVIRDRPFLLFALTYLGTTLVYSQMNTMLPLYMDAELGFPTERYLTLISLNAAMVVVFQLPLTTYLERFDNNLLLALGAACYAIGFGMFGFADMMSGFVLGMVILTVGEMVLVPVAQAVVAELAPADMRGRYMGFYGLVWGTSFMIGPLAGGQILAFDGGQYRRVLWYASLVIGLIGAGAFLILGRYLKRRAASIRWAEMMQRYGKATGPEATLADMSSKGTPIVPGAKAEGG